MIAAVVVAVLDQPPTEAKSRDEKGAVLERLPLRVTSYFPFSDKQNNQHTASPAPTARKPIRIHSQSTTPDMGNAIRKPAQHQMPGGSW